MKFSVGSLLAIVTLVGSILIGGSNFGELRSQTRTNKSYNIETRAMQVATEDSMRIEIRDIAYDLRKENMESLKMIAQMSTDIRWMKESMSRRNN